MKIRAALVAGSFASLVAVAVACSSSSGSDGGSGTGDGTADTACAVLRSSVGGCSTPTACDKAEANACESIVGTNFSDDFLQQLVSCNYTCGADGGSGKIDVDCARSAYESVADTTAYTTFRSTLCSHCGISCDAAADASVTNTESISGYTFYKAFSDSYLTGLTSACLTGADGGESFTCLREFTSCAGAYQDTQVVLPSACKSSN